MTVFVAFSPAGKDISELIKSAFEEPERFQLGSDKWLVARKDLDTALEIWRRLNDHVPADSEGNNKVAGVIAVEVSNYYGFADAGIWQWIKKRSEQ